MQRCPYPFWSQFHNLHIFFIHKWLSYFAVLLLFDKNDGLICSYISNSEGYIAQIPQYPLLLQCLYRVCASALHYGKVQPWHKALYSNLM